MPKTKIFAYLRVKTTTNQFLINCLMIFMLGVFLFPSISFSTTITENNIIRLTNYERVKKGLDALTKNDSLQIAAEKKAEAIFENDSFSHRIGEMTFSEWIKEVDYEFGD